MNPFFEILKRGIRKHCPRCDESNLFEGWGKLVEACSKCGLAIRKREPETWFFMYMSTAGITGIFIISLFFISPQNEALAKAVVVFLALAAFFLTQNLRKSIAIAIDYWVDTRSQNPRH